MGSVLCRLCGSLRCEGAEIFGDATAHKSVDALSVEIAELRWTDPERPELTLEAPAQVRWLYEGDLLRERLLISPFVLRGADMQASAALNPEAGLNVDLKNVSLARVDHWLRAELPAYYVESIEVAMTRFRPYLEGVVRVAAEESINESAVVRLQVAAKLEPQGITAEELAFNSIKQVPRSAIVLSV